jgi:hypothetical protein
MNQIEVQNAKTTKYAVKTNMITNKKTATIG